MELQSKATDESDQAPTGLSGAWAFGTRSSLWCHAQALPLIIERNDPTTQGEVNQDTPHLSEPSEGRGHV